MNKDNDQNSNKNLSVNLEGYKGVRDFYPEDQFVQEYIFKIWEVTLESFGYEKYNSSILEYSDLYKAKSGEEIVNQQTYNFEDRGGRSVTIRPEMTPTIARMVAKKKRDLVFPLRWFSIPNLFRYERPQRGRLREHFQLNVDMFGVSNTEADCEIVEIAYSIMRNFGLNDQQFEIRINDLLALNQYLKDSGLNDIEAHQYRKLLDKKDKMDNFDEEVERVLGRKLDLSLNPSEMIQAIIDKLSKRGISNVVFDNSIVRGFDYYTGMVMEVYDTGTENNRSVFGGGRYDNLLEIFDEDKIPAVGFGSGDVIMKDVLETYNLLPSYKPNIDIYICVLNDSFYDYANVLASELRFSGLSVAVDYSGKKIGDQISKANKRGIKLITCIGENEVENNKFEIKDLEKNTTKTVALNKLVKFVKDNTN